MSVDNLNKFIKVSNDSQDGPGNNYLEGGFDGNINHLLEIKDGKTYLDLSYEDFGLTPAAIKDQLKGMEYSLTDPITDEPWSDDFYIGLIDQSVADTEKEFDITILPREKFDRLDYSRGDFNSFMYTRTYFRPILYVEQVKLYFNNQTILNYPQDWLKVNERAGQLEVQPSLLASSWGGGVNVPYLAVTGYPYGTPPVDNHEFAPQMIGVQYVCGMLPNAGDYRYTDWQLQPDLSAYIAKKGAIQVLERWGRNILGPGIAGEEASIDNMSSRIETTQSAEYTASTADINLLKADMKDNQSRLKAYYGTNIGVIA